MNNQMINDVNEKILNENNEINGKEFESTSVDLSYRKIEKLPKPLEEVNEYIKYLNLSNNCIKIFPETFQTCNLIEFDCSFNKLKIFPHLNCNFNYLSKLNLSHNKLLEIPTILYTNLPNLQIIDLSHNFIKFSQTPFKCYKYLQKIFLNHNILEEFPFWLLNCLCKNLTEINLESNIYMNGIKDSNKSFVFNKSLKVINLNDCSFTSGCIQFLQYFSFLEFLSISNCDYRKEKTNLWEFEPLNLHWKQTLKILKLSNIYLSNEPVCLQYLENLEYLDLSRNNLSWMNCNFNTFVKLSYCDLSNNKLIDLPEDLGNVKTLTHLNLSYNMLNHLPETLNNLTKLIYLDLYDNEFEENPIIIENFPQMNYFDIYYNHFKLETDEKITVLINNLRTSSFIKEERMNDFKTIPSPVFSRNYESSSTSSLFDEPSDSEINYLLPVTLEKEYWDEDEDCDEFDPTLINPRNYEETNKKEPHLSYPNNFCPADLHQKSPFNKQVFLEIYEGQFDDE